VWVWQEVQEMLWGGDAALTNFSWRAVPRLGLVILLVALAACEQESARLSIGEARTCAADAFKGHAGTFSQDGNAIAYSFESPNGSAKVIVTFDDRRRPQSTFFQSAPLGSHEQLMDAAQAIKECVAYGRAFRGANGKDEPGPHVGGEHV
jgi:hypothetical protein